MKRLHFADRRFARLAEATDDAAMRHWLIANQVRRKRLDAVAMLEAMRTLLADDPAPFQATFRFERALVWEQFVATADSPNDLEASVLTELRLDCEAWRDVQRAALGRLHAPRQVDPTVQRRVLERFRRQRGLWRRADLDAWLTANALDAAALERLLRREATLDAEAASCKSTLPLAMLDHLRLSGGFIVLLQMVRTKAAALTDAPPPPLEPHRQAVLDWYFEHRLGLMRPPSLAAFLTEAGWEDENELLLAVWRDYCSPGFRMKYPAVGGTRFRLYPSYAEGFAEPEVVELSLPAGTVRAGLVRSLDVRGQPGAKGRTLRSTALCPALSWSCL